MVDSASTVPLIGLPPKISTFCHTSNRSIILSAYAESMLSSACAEHTVSMLSSACAESMILSAHAENMILSVQAESMLSSACVLTWAPAREDLFCNTRDSRAPLHGSPPPSLLITKVKGYFRDTQLNPSCFHLPGVSPLPVQMLFVKD